MAKPKCPECGSDKLVLGGLCSYHWRKGRWALIRGSDVVSDCPTVTCEACGVDLDCDDVRNPDGNLTRQLMPHEREGRFSRPAPSGDE